MIYVVNGSPGHQATGLVSKVTQLIGITCQMRWPG